MVLTAQRKPEGGVHFISVLQLCRVWQAYRTAQIRMLDVRVWFAAQEVVARRCQRRAGQLATYTRAELAQLVGRAGGVGAALQRLHTAGVLTWELHTITFPHIPQPEQHAVPLHLMLAGIPNSRRRVPVPRRLLRFVAKSCTRVVLATLLGHLFRCLYYRQGHCQPAGLCKASWIAAVFGVSERAVKAARQQLEARGILLRQDTPQ